MAAKFPHHNVSQSTIPPIDAAEVSYHPCRGSYWAWVESWLCPAAATIWAQDHQQSLLLSGANRGSNMVNASSARAITAFRGLHHT